MPKPHAQPVLTLDGVACAAMFRAACARLEAQEEAINALNVYPVPDGDTGTNMLFTMRAALGKVERAVPPRADEVLQALADGSLMGARGNSGVILSQIIRGVSKAVQGKAVLSGDDIALGLQTGSEQAYKVVPVPVEGTILTVSREAAAAVQAMSDRSSLAAVMEVAATTAKASVARTPFLLAILRENGVVDSGGQGLAVLFDGAAGYLRGDVQATPPPGKRLHRAPARERAATPAGTPGTYGYCTEFLIQDCRAGAADVRHTMLGLGDSVLVAGDAALIKVHLHTKQPETAIIYARSVGSVQGIKKDNIDEQHRDFAAKHAAKIIGEVAIAAVAAGEGIERLMRSLGAAAIIPGGQTMNPSAHQIVEAVHSIPAATVIVLPNNSNVVLTAHQALTLMTGKRKVAVVPTQDVAQGIAALLAFNYEAGSEANVEAMERARTLVKTGGVTRAVRSASMNGRPVAAGQIICLADGKIIAATQNVGLALRQLLEYFKIDGGNAVTLYFGAGVTGAQTKRHLAALRRWFPDTPFEIVAGGQPHYHYFIAVD